MGCGEKQESVGSRSVNMNLNVSYPPSGCFWWVPLFVVFSLIQGMSDILTMESFTGPLSLPGRVSSDICGTHAVGLGLSAYSPAGLHSIPPQLHRGVLSVQLPLAFASHQSWQEPLMWTAMSWRHAD